MRINEINLKFQDEDLKHDIYFYFYAELREDKAYWCSFRRSNRENYSRELIQFHSTIGNPEYLFNVVNEFRKKPETYFWSLNKLFSKKDIKFDNPDITQIPILGNDDQTLSLIKFY